MWSQPPLFTAHGPSVASITVQVANKLNTQMASCVRTYYVFQLHVNMEKA